MNLDFLIGLWPIVSKFSIAGGAIAALLVFAWFSPVFKKTALWIALGIAVYVAAYAIGVNDGESRVQKQWNAALERAAVNGEQERADAERTVAGEPPDSVRNDEWNRDNWRPEQSR